MRVSRFSLVACEKEDKLELSAATYGQTARHRAFEEREATRSSLAECQRSRVKGKHRTD